MVEMVFGVSMPERWRAPRQQVNPSEITYCSRTFQVVLGRLSLDGSHRQCDRWGAPTGDRTQAALVKGEREAWLGCGGLRREAGRRRRGEDAGSGRQSHLVGRAGSTGDLHGGGGLTPAFVSACEEPPKHGHPPMVWKAATREAHPDGTERFTGSCLTAI